MPERQANSRGRSSDSAMCLSVSEPPPTHGDVSARGLSVTQGPLRTPLQALISSGGRDTGVPALGDQRAPQTVKQALWEEKFLPGSEGNA